MARDRFTLTPEHVKLLRRMNVGWQDCETGAPEIDPKRPYGNSDVPGDVADILEWEGHLVRNGWSEETEMSDAAEERALALHAETETALQVVLSTGSFEPGEYVCDWPRNNWRRVEK